MLKVVAEPPRFRSKDFMLDEMMTIILLQYVLKCLSSNVQIFAIMQMLI